MIVNLIYCGDLKMKRLLLHTCCAPCMVAVTDILLEENEFDVTSYFYNPNIHPKVEYERRKQTLIDYCSSIDLNLEINDNYNMVGFIKDVVTNKLNETGKRCEYCYKTRLEESFRFAKENGYDSVTTTLLISPYQNHDLIKKVAEDLAKKYEIEFYYRDFRPVFRQGQNKARELGLYRQKFCGCIYSIDNGNVKELK